MKKVKLVRELPIKDVELMLVAAWLCGFQSAAEHKTLSHPDNKQEWRRLKTLLYEN